MLGLREVLLPVFGRAMRVRWGGKIFLNSGENLWRSRQIGAGASARIWLLLLFKNAPRCIET